MNKIIKILIFIFIIITNILLLPFKKKTIKNLTSTRDKVNLEYIRGTNFTLETCFVELS